MGSQSSGTARDRKASNGGELPPLYEAVSVARYGDGEGVIGWRGLPCGAQPHTGESQLPTEGPSKGI